MALKFQRTGGKLKVFSIKSGRNTVLDYSNPHKEIEKDETIGRILPSVVSPCALGRTCENGTCIAPAILQRIMSHISEPMTKQPARIGYEVGGGSDLMTIRKRTGCDTDKCILKVASDQRWITLADAGIEEQLALKRVGPTNVELLNDAVIHSQLYAWMFRFPEFWAYNFNMLDFAEHAIVNGFVADHPDTLKTVDWHDLYYHDAPYPIGLGKTEAASLMMANKRRHGVRTGACIINSDVSNGPGKHWMALFVDLRGEKWTVEFFNSAAIAPESEWLVFIDDTMVALRDIIEKEKLLTTKVEPIFVDRVWHQHSKTECGVYSLFYIYSRLKGLSYEYFLANPIPDQWMLEFRQHLFATDDGVVGKPFNFEEYANRVHVKWDIENITKKNQHTI